MRLKTSIDSETTEYEPEFLRRCDICGKKSEFMSTWFFSLSRTLFDFKSRDCRFPEVVAVCRECRYKEPIAKMYDAVFKRMLNRNFGKYNMSLMRAKKKKSKHARNGILNKARHK